MQPGKVNINEEYVFYETKKLGKGNFGQVYQGMSRYTQQPVAVKKLLTETLVQWTKNPAIQKEIKIVKDINHPNVLRFFDVIQNGSNIYIITQLCAGGDLKSFNEKERQKLQSQNQIQAGRGYISQLQIFRFLCEIVDAMAFVNSEKGYMHRDLKLENIMLDTQNHIKIVDFGLAREVIGKDVNKMERYSAKGTPLYAAPQVVRGEPFSTKCDVWSCGTLIYELLTGKNYFSTATTMFNLRKLHQNLKDSKVVMPQGFNAFFNEWIPKMMAYSENDRVDFKTLNQYLKNNKKQIELSIDPTFSEQATVKKIQNKPQQISPVKTVGNTPQQPNSQPTKVQEQTYDAFRRIDAQQENYQMMVKIFNYCELLYSRCRIFPDLINKLNASTYPPDSGSKYTLMFLQLATYITTCNQIIHTLRSEVITLPDKTVNVSAFDSQNKQNFINYSQDYIKKIQQEKLTYLTTLQQIAAKLQSQSYKDRFPKLYQMYPKIYQSLQELLNTPQMMEVDKYLSNYRLFLTSECRMPAVESQPDQMLSLYCWCLYVSKLKESISENNYMNKDYVTKQKELLEKMDRNQRLEMIKRLS